MGDADTKSVPPPPDARQYDAASTGTGKTHLCIGVASAVIRSRARGRFFNLVDLVNQLEQEKAAGRSGRLAETLLRYDVIVIDELGYLPFSQPGGSASSSGSNALPCAARRQMSATQPSSVLLAG